jgi:pimeloyl-ACP methyl ester carboxylesterase
MRIVKALVVLIVICIFAGIGFVYLAPQKATSLAMDMERHRSGLTRKEINLPNGLHYVYLEGGKGEPLILLHGFGANKDNFVRTAKFLTPHYRVIIPDHIGFGESSHPQDTDYKTATQAARIRMLAQALGITKAHLGGSSMGGQICLMYAFFYPDEVKSLWLLDPGGIWSAPKSEFQELFAKTGENPLMARNTDEFAKIFSFVMSDHPFVPKPILNVMAQERIRNYDLEMRIIKDIASESIEKYVNGLKTPALIVWGDKDRVIHPATAEILHKMMPASEVIMMKGIGHLPMLEQPRRSAEDYLKFREKLGKDK